MNITINGNSEAGDFANVQEILQKMDIDPAVVVVELNGKIVPRAEYESTKLTEGDTVEIVHFVAGG